MRCFAFAAAFGMALSGRIAAQETADPASHGRLRQQDIAVRVEAGPVVLRALPIDSALLPLLTAEASSALRALLASHAEDISRTASRFGGGVAVFLVTVFATAEDATFDAERFTIESRNRLFRPLDILPLSPLWRGRNVPQRETLSALYVFESGIAIFEPFAVLYGGNRSDDWGRRLPRIERERARRPPGP